MNILILIINEEDKYLVSGETFSAQVGLAAAPMVHGSMITGTTGTTGLHGLHGLHPNTCGGYTCDRSKKDSEGHFHECPLIGTCDYQKYPYPYR